jgi:hypothetical protein
VKIGDHKIVSFERLVLDRDIYMGHRKMRNWIILWRKSTSGPLLRAIISYPHNSSRALFAKEP